MFYKQMLLAKHVLLLPGVHRELSFWRKITAKLPAKLRELARSSLEKKAFHCLGGAVYALFPGVNSATLLRAIVALQTISDYLDNLCDRGGIFDPRAFRQLHLSFLEALQPGKELSDYYRYYPEQESSYLPVLVRCCQQCLLQMPHLTGNQEDMLKLADYYCNLQVKKHTGEAAERDVQSWIEQTFPPTLEWPAWAAACGSTLGIFMLMANSFVSKTAAARITNAYFPWVQGLHIMLDYLIDRHEDEQYGDLNFTFYYPSVDQCLDRICYLAEEAVTQTSRLPYANFHHTVIGGLVAIYGSDRKVGEQDLLQEIKDSLISDRFTSEMHGLCSLLRRVGLLS